MKSRLLHVLFLVALAMICSSCSPASPISYDHTNDSQVETSTLFEPNPFEKTEEVSVETVNSESQSIDEVNAWFQYVDEQMKEDKVTDVAVDFEGGQMHYTYDGTPVRIPYMYRVVGGKNSDSVGLIVLCNGFPVKSWLEGETEQDAKLFQVAEVHCDPDDPEDFTMIPLYFIPEGKQGELVKVQIYDYCDANFDPDQTEQKLLTYFVVGGCKYRTRCVGMVDVYMQQDGLVYRFINNWTIYSFHDTMYPSKDGGNDLWEENQVSSPLLQKNATIWKLRPVPVQYRHRQSTGRGYCF